MTDRPLDWDGVQTLIAVARARSVRGAAGALGVHHTTVGRRIDALEARIGARLFDRRPDGWALTAAGEEVAAAGRGFDDALTAARRRVEGRDAAPAGTVTITVAEPLFVHAIAPRLPEMATAHPGLDLRFDTAFDLRDLARREADVAVRMDNNPPDALVGKRLFPYREAAYAAPGHLDGPAPRWLGWAPGDDGWVAGTDLPRLPVWGAFPTLGAQVAAARAGLGVALLPCLIGDAAEGLARATDRPPRPSRDIWLLTHPDLRATARVRAAMGFLERAIRDARPAIEGAP
ncbi:LysR family transcriptional regulator [Jannaschia sp. Os4]|uniref:LysR family transcriptional regulator n=1 Tax=Jannaschia sp. Os4 TaxID=2807617 RepID=UPI0019398512|nr:LysR family transcriptional regulator [Jannaschia sp. Os4]MBM2576077.1 LysR family transcriptional regulator [Jannaschia sp. Os4]